MHGDDNNSIYMNALLNVYIGPKSDPGVLATDIAAIINLDKVLSSHTFVKLRGAKLSLLKLIYIVFQCC